MAKGFFSAVSIGLPNSKGQTNQQKVLDLLNFEVQCHPDETSKIFESVAEFV